MPMEPSRGEKLPQGPGYSYQVKWDGIRILAYYSGDKSDIVLRGKKGEEKTALFPELADLRKTVHADSLLLDVEIIALESGIPSFFKLMKRERSSPAAALRLAERIPVFYMVFDLLMLNNLWLLQEQWVRRQELLHGVIVEDGCTFITKNYEDGFSLLQSVKERNMEGIVAKKQESPYIPGPRKSSYWIKTKLEQMVEAYVGGLFLKGERPSSLLLGLKEKGSVYGEEGRAKLRFIGSLSSGLSEEELLRWHSLGMQSRIDEAPFQNPPFPGKREVLWMEPHQKIKVTFNEWTPELKLRAPRAFKSTRKAFG